MNLSIRKNVTIIVIICLNIFLFQTLISQTKIEWKEVNGVSIPIPPREHPRLYVTSKNIPDLKKRMSDPVLKPIWEELVKMGESNTQYRVEIDALRYLITRDKKLGRKTIESALDTIKKSIYENIHDKSSPIGIWYSTGKSPGGKYSWSNIDRARNLGGRMIVTGAIVYDWCYDLITEEEKKQFIEELVRIAGVLEIGYPPVRNNAIVSHGSEAMLLRDLISAAVAIYDDFPEMYNLAVGRFFKEYVVVRNWFYPGHAYYQGGYDAHRHGNELYPLWIFDRLGVGNVYNPAQQFVSYQWIYIRRPDGGLLRRHDSAERGARGTTWSLGETPLLSSSYYKDGYVFNEYLRNPSISATAKIFEFLWRDPNLKPIPPDKLPLTRYSSFPFGWMIARTGWDEESAIVEMKVNVYYFADHMHLDAGTFQIYYKGPLALDAGLYRGQSSEHDHNYYKRTIAHNGLLIYDPDEQFGKGRAYQRVNDGGQRMPNDFREPSNFDVFLDEKNGYKVGEIIGHWFGPDYTTPDYTYLKGDITEAYSQKVKEVKRSFVFLNTKKANVAGVLIVFDKIVSSNPQFKKFWLLHSMEEPSINSSESIITRNEYGERGKLITSTLLPKRENIEISSIGGPGKEFWVAGSNHPPDVLLRPGQNISDIEAGAWRIEVSPKTSASTDYFLNVMQIMDRENGKKQEVTFIEDKNIYGVKVVDRVVVFNNESAYMDRPFKFTVSGSGTYKFLITDLIDGTWQIWKDGSVFIPALVVSKDEGILYYEGSNGTYELRR